MPADRNAVGREINRLKKPKGRTLSEEHIRNKISGLEKRLRASIRKKDLRKTYLPRPTFNDTLPITAKKNQIIDSISKNQVVVIAGATGSGKTTQIPKFCLAAGRGIEGLIGCTQPRRIAAITVANRIAEELGEGIGESVGYKIRFKDKTRQTTYVKIMTDGILLAETQGDPYLKAYDTIIVDEAHERSLNIDFILGILIKLLKKRPDLKLIITSATIDTQKFSTAFDNAPIIEVSGRMYPVEVRYLATETKPSGPSQEENGEQSHIEKAVWAVDQIQKESPFGDILVFMPTEQDIRETRELIEGRNYHGVSVLPLFARLTGTEQSRVFARTAGRKIIVATNIAETSLTIPGIKFVVDTGLARISQYLPRSRTTSLPVVPISKSSADQRMGRCGRVESGVCLRLFSEADYQSRPLYTHPEILRANLAEVILRMIALNIGDISRFPFIDRPAPRSIKDGFNLLVELDAIAEKHVAKGKKKKAAPEKNKISRGRFSNRYRLTKNGRLMANMPIDPRLSRMLIEARKENCVDEIAVIASALSIQDPRERPTEKAFEADKAHEIFKDPSSDFISLLNIWNRHNDVWNAEKPMGSMKKFCREHYLSFKRMREWRDIHSQISTILKDYGLQGDRAKKQSATETVSRFGSKYTAIHKSILSGFLSNIAQKKEKNIFKAAKGKTVMIFPGSALFNKAQTWIVAAELIETSRLFARTTANIDSAWLEELGKRHCKYTYLNPHWERKREEVIAAEQVSLFGLVVVPARPVAYGKINPEEASSIFIRSALVEGDVKKIFPFMEHNRNLIAEIQNMENKIRRRDLLVSQQDIFQFYQERLAGVYDIRTLEKTIGRKGDDDFLKMKISDLAQYSPEEEELALFPDNITYGDRQYQCTYSFEPGQEDDGITLKIPSALTAMVPSESIDWMVPGLHREKITALIKGLPKTFRKKLVPVATTVDTIMREIPKSNRSLISALGEFIYHRFGLDIPANAWSDEALPDHLKMRIAITGPQGEVLRSSRDRAILCQNVHSRVKSQEFESARKEWERRGITRWDFPDLPETIQIRIGNRAKWVVYPGLAEDFKNGQTVNLRLFENRDEAIKSHKKGIAALLGIHFSKELKFLKKKLTIPKSYLKKADWFGGSRKLEKKLYEAVINKLFNKNIRTKASFYRHAKSVAGEILPLGQELTDQTIAILGAYHEARNIIFNLEKSHGSNQPALDFLNGLIKDIDRLVPDRFMELYETDRLVHIVRYIKAVAMRAQRAFLNFAKDQAKAKEVEMFNDILQKFLNTLSPITSEAKRNAIEAFFWLLEEYKVSLFAQELKTALPVSKKRLDMRVKEIERMV